MAPKNRSDRNRRLEGTNIKVWIKGGKTYYYYSLPNGQRVPLAHDDEKTSIEAALLLNQRFRNKEDIYERVLGLEPVPKPPIDSNPVLVFAIDQFIDEWLPNQNYKEKSEQGRKAKLENWKTTWPHLRVNEMTTFLIAQFLRKISNESGRQHLILFDQFFRWCSSTGYSNQRPIIDIEKKKQEKRRRKRHNWDGYKKIYDASPDWLKNAQDAALYTLQRRSDLVAISFDEHIDIKNRAITVSQDKSENYDEPVFINIKMGDELYDTVMRSHWSGINCPYLVHCRPKRITKTSRAAKLHPFAVTADYLTRAYSAVRDEIGAYDHLPKIERPGLHSIRALGIWLYSKAGYDDSYVMALAGHASTKMKAHYEDGHEKKLPFQVEAGLSLSQVKLTDINWETDLPETLKVLADFED